MKTAIKVLVIIGTVIGWIWWITTIALGGVSSALVSSFMPEAAGMTVGNIVFQFLAMTTCTVFGFIAATKKVKNAATLVMSIFLILSGIALFPLGSYIPFLLFVTAGIIGFIKGCTKEKTQTEKA